MGVNKKGQEVMIAFVGAIVIIIAIIGIWFFFNGGITGQAVNLNSGEGNSLKLINPIQKCRDVQVPYEVTETYSDQEPYQGFKDSIVDLKYSHFGEGRASYSELFNVRYKGIVTVKNVDSETGYFTVEMKFKTLDGIVMKSTGGYVQSGESREFNIYYDIDVGEDVDFSYNVNPGTKTITSPVTKYRTVTKTRTVTKYKTEEVCD
tara:strand:- start:539 stop:1153 length:615 start_codon:yes stop_codon:yes gene_type:complete